MIDANFFCGLPRTFQNICSVYPPTVKEVLSNPQFYQCCKLLTYSQEQLEDDLADAKEIPTPLDFLFINAYNNKEFREVAKSAFRLFIKQDVSLIYEKKCILIGGEQAVAQAKSISDLKFLNEDNYFEFQNMVRAAVGIEPVVPVDPNESLITKRLRKKVRQSKKKLSKSGGTSFGCNLAAICCMNVGINPLTIGEMSYMSVSVLTSMYQQKEKYDTDIRSLIAGADPKKVKPKYWIGELSDAQEVNI